MQFTSTLLAAVLAATAAVAAPTPAVKSMMVNGQWTINGFTRTCDDADTSCEYRFGINRNDGTLAPICDYTVTGAPASQAPANGIVCGAFTVSSAWSGQFGPGNGFTTFAVVADREIIYPAYSDSQLVNGAAVEPDQSYTPQALP